MLIKNKHPRIAEGYDCFQDQDHHGFTSLVYVMKFYKNGNLAKYIGQHYSVSCNVPFETKKKWMIQLLEGVEFMHKLRKSHRDLKLENLFVDQNENIVIGDFGATKEQKQDQVGTIIGTSTTISPEILM